MRRLLTPHKKNIIELAARERPERRKVVEKLFAQHDQALRLFLRGRSVPLDEIEDLVQELFTRLMGSQRLEEKMAAATGSNRSYFLTMANGLIVDRWRKRRVRNAYASAQREIEADRIDERTPERIVAAQLELEAYMAVILEMPLNWRVALVLKRIRNMSYEDIALHMGVTVRQVERYLRRAMRRIQKAQRKIKAAGRTVVLKNLQEIMGGDVTHALVRLWSDELSEAEAIAIHSRVQGDPHYQEELEGLFAAFDSIGALEDNRAIEEIAGDYRRLLQKRRSRRSVALGMAAGMLLAIGAALTYFSPWGSRDDSHLQKYFTHVGEQQTIELDDGSVITLNTGGQLVVDYSGQVRRVLLERGEAYFEVAEDPDRAFTVDMGVRAVTVVGTEFNIRKNPHRYQITVIEGAVALHESADEVSFSHPPVSVDGQPVVISAPEQRRVEEGWVAEFNVSRNRLRAFRPESMDQYSDWRSGVIEFSREPLYRVVRELNRYSRKRILIEDASVMELNVYSVVRIRDIDAALSSLEQVLPVEVTRHYDRIVITAAAGN